MRDPEKDPGLRDLQPRASSDAPSSTPNDRAETGHMRFGDDWTGVFIRGDNAGGYALALGAVLDDKIPKSQRWLYELQCRQLLDLLAGSAEWNGPKPQQMKPFHEAQSGEQPEAAQPADHDFSAAALRDAQSSALRDAADEIAFAPLAKVVVPDDWRESYERAYRQSDIEAMTRIEAAAWLRDRADAISREGQE